jgi:hypothetical protein
MRVACYEPYAHVCYRKSRVGHTARMSVTPLAPRMPHPVRSCVTFLQGKRSSQYLEGHNGAVRQGSEASGNV